MVAADESQHNVAECIRSMTSSHVVISYSRADSRFVDRLVDELSKAGIGVWVDRLGIGSGDWERKIEVAIESASDFVLIVSQHAKKSDRVRDEFKFARQVISDERIHVVTLQRTRWLGVDRYHSHDAEEGRIPQELVRTLLKLKSDDIVSLSAVRSHRDERGVVGPSQPSKSQESGQPLRSAADIYASQSEGLLDVDRFRIAQNIYAHESDLGRIELLLTLSPPVRTILLDNMSRNEVQRLWTTLNSEQRTWLRAELEPVGRAKLFACLDSSGRHFVYRANTDLDNREMNEVFDERPDLKLEMDIGTAEIESE